MGMLHTVALRRWSSNPNTSPMDHHPTVGVAALIVLADAGARPSVGSVADDRERGRRRRRATVTGCDPLPVAVRKIVVELAALP